MNSINQKRLEEILLLEKNLHPKAKLRDYYKLFYQAIYGPGHLLNNLSEAKRYLKHELSNLKENDDPDFQDLSLSKDLDFVRVNLNFVKRNDVAFDSLFEVLIESASAAIEFDKLSFKKYLNVFWKVTSLIFPDLNEFNEQAFELKRILNQGDYVLHHSETYREAYKPHYRVVSKQIWNESFEHLLFY